MAGLIQLPSYSPGNALSMAGINSGIGSMSLQKQHATEFEFI